MREGSLFFRCVGVRRRPFWRGAIFRVSSAYARTCVLRIRLRAALCRRGLHTRRLGRPVAEGDAGDVSRYWRCQYALWLRLCAHVRFAHTAPRGAMSPRAPYAPPRSAFASQYAARLANFKRQKKLRTPDRRRSPFPLQSPSALWAAQTKKKKKRFDMPCDSAYKPPSPTGRDNPSAR